MTVDLGLPMLRNSERTSFKRCQQRWYWGYRCGLKPKGQPSNPLWFGTGIHLAFADWYIPGTARGRDLRETWVEYVNGEIRYIKTNAIAADGSEEKIAEYVEAKELGIAMLDGYLNRYGHDESWEVIAPEQTFSVLIPDAWGDPIIQLNGTFDGVYRDHSDGLIKLMEHKTAAAISTKHLSLDDQAGTYWAIASHTLREQELIGRKEQISGIQYNFLRKAKEDSRPVGPDGMVHNKPTKAHYIDQLARVSRVSSKVELSTKNTITELEGYAKRFKVEVLGDVSKVQPTANFVRQFVERTAYERKTQISRIAKESAQMNALRAGDLDITKNPTRDCAFDCDFFDMCELHESTPDWKEYRDAMFTVKDPYADHRKSA